jgi:hypothetical protein
MIKLKFEFEVPLPRRAPRDIVALTALLPGPDRRCLAFGWAAWDEDPVPRSERYWLADIGADGVRHRWLDPALTERLVALTARPPDSSGSYTRIHAFRHGTGLGLLLGSQEVHLYADIDAEPAVLTIANPFSGFGAPRLALARYDSHYLPLHVGPAHGGLVPVVLSAPDGSPGESRHASLLQVDADGGGARWLHTDAEGRPVGLRHADSAPFLEPHQPGAMRLEGNQFVWNTPPLILDALWRDDGGWLAYIGGFSTAYFRFGLAPSLLARHAPDLALREAQFQAREDSFGRFCASRDRLIVSPLRKNGPGKYKQTIVALADREEHAIKLPRGYSQHSVLDYGDGTYWLSPMRWGYACDALVACSAA